MKNNKDIHARMRQLHDVLVKHKHHDASCTCRVLHVEMKNLWLQLNGHKRAFQARAGPFPGVSMPPVGRPEVGDMLNEIRNDDYWLLKQTEHD